MRGTVGYDKARRTWYYRHDLPPGPDGKRRQTTRRGFRRKRDAEEALARSLWLTFRAGPPPPGFTVAEYLDLQIEARSDEYAPSTLGRLRHTARVWVRGSPLDVPIPELRQTHVSRWVAWMRERGRGPTTISTAWRSVLALLRPLIDAGQVPAEVAKAHTPPMRQRPPTVWTPDDVRLVLSRLRGDLLYAPVAVAVTTGLRAGELLALRWTDLQDGAVIVRRSVGFAGGQAVVKETKTGAVRRVELYPETLEILEEHRADQKRREWALPEWDTLGLVFPAWTGGYWRPQALSAQFQRRIRDLPVPRIRFHDLRHTHASHLLAAGVPVTTVAARLGHATPQITLRVYAHLIPGQQAEAVAKGSAFLGLVRDQAEVVTIGDHEARRAATTWRK